jgi:hypothetical protein
MPPGERPGGGRQRRMVQRRGIRGCFARWCLLPPKHVQQGVSAKEDSFKMRIPAALAACMGSQLVNHRYGMEAPHRTAARAPAAL